ncbi:helix-turn-helix transcriptional regulator [Pandoraea sp.]|uniref:helix-turn-helix domain-containing protein n=1 Tax=Pandoraea sp. TaxID=1883445 RepID=UPI00122B595D|nr:helix-turn-helix transcriptional regulator [Pandoraea sp.]TAL53800.1 MAG: XRE family transcriptional regulator [Pandoraea sp.]TAM17053.1 MAG: XRE family transcriptional regulator [Pandoraea sp.]
MTIFSERLREERKRLGLNQADFAKQGGVKKDAQLNYENGTRRPDASYLEALAAIGVDVLYVLTGEHSASTLSADEQMLLAGYRSLDARGRAGVLGAISGLTQTPAAERKSKSQVMVGGSNNQQAGGAIKTTTRTKKRAT